MGKGSRRRERRLKEKEEGEMTGDSRGPGREN